jgi:F-type H+-transporting ATPase subunit a
VEGTLEEGREQKRGWRWGVNRWFVLLFIILGFIGARYYPPILPHIQLPAEHILEEPLISGPVIGKIYLTNTLLATLITDVILLVIALIVYRSVRGGDLVPRGFAGAVEALIEVLYNLTESTAGKWAKSIFPFFATITMLVLIANWMELLPGVDSIGKLEHAEHGGYPIQEVFPGVGTLVEADTQSGQLPEGGFSLVPYVRVVSTDLNFTVALALISVFMTQVFGARSSGINYFTKFVNVKGLFSKPVFGAIDFAVGLLETISEFSKILSFSFRLFGNLFAGTVLLFVIGTLVPVFAQSLFLGLEFFVGLIQAIVFGMLTMVFMAQATQGHGGESEH